MSHSTTVFPPISPWRVRLDKAGTGKWSGPTAPTKYPPNTVALDPLGDKTPSSLCLTIHFVGADSEARVLFCEVGFNPAIPQNDDQAARKLEERWEDIRSGIELALSQVARRHMALPIELDALLFVMASPPVRESERAMISVDFEFGRRRRELKALRDLHILYLQKPLAERLECWWQRLFDKIERARFERQEATGRFNQRLLDSKTKAELFADNARTAEALRRALVQQLGDPMQSLFAVLFANDPTRVAQLGARGCVPGAMTTVLIYEKDLEPATTDEVQKAPLMMTETPKLDDLVPKFVPNPAAKQPKPAIVPVMRADTMMIAAPEPGIKPKKP